MGDFLSRLWACFDSSEPLFSAREVASWPDGQAQWLQERGVLCATTSASRVGCSCCPSGHVEDVLEVPDADPPRFFIACPESVTVEVDPEALRQWTIDGDAAASLIAAALGLQGRPTPIESGRVWRLGTTRWQQTSREVLLARGLGAEDAARIAAHAGQAGRPIVLVSGLEPLPHIWPGRPPACVALSRVMSQDATGLQADGVLLHDLVQKADELQAQVELLPLDPAGKRRVLRRHAQAAASSNQEDEVLVGAYQACHSYREAAKVLSARLKTKITKDKVKRAVDRAGGPSAVINGANSNSVVRAVASHRRDKGGRF